jgi:uncharacterized membrane protein YfcA
METIPLYWVFFLTLGLSYFFALSGLGAAMLLMPIFHSLGFPINTAKSVALLANGLSLTAATFDNLRSGRIDLKLGLPIIIFSFVAAPVGAYVSTFIDKNLILWLFVAFLIFAGISALLPKKEGEAACQDKRPKMVTLSIIGTVAGLLSGMLGIGGGGIISALMLRMGCHAKKIAVITALAVPFSSFSGFFAYAAGGHISWPLVATVAAAALLGGYAGNRTMQTALPEKLIKRAIGIVSLLFAAKILFDLLTSS